MPVMSDPLALTEKEEKAGELDDVLGTASFAEGADGLLLPGHSGEAAGARQLPVTARSMVCIDGPCRHYAEVEHEFEAANRDQTFRQVRRYCKALQAGGELMELTDANVFRCSLHSVAPLVKARRLVAKTKGWLAKASEISKTIS